MELPHLKQMILHRVFVSWVCFACILKTMSGEEFTVKRRTPDPVFVDAGQTLRLKVRIHHPDMSQHNTTAFWVFSPDSVLDQDGKEVLLLRQIASDRISHYSYDTRASFEEHADLVLVNASVNDSGRYVCKFRRPPRKWDTYVVFHVIVDDAKDVVQHDLPRTVYVATGDTLMLNTTQITSSFRGNKLSTFWDFRSHSSPSYKQPRRIIALKSGLVERFDKRASLLEGNTTLMLRKTTRSDSGIYSFRTLETKFNVAQRLDFLVIVQDKPRAEIDCPGVVALTEGQHFTCWCKATAVGDLTPHISWIKDGRTIRGPSLSGRQDLPFVSFSGNMSGTYICRASLGTLIDEQTFVTTLIQTENPVNNKCLEERFEWYLILSSGFGGVILGIMITLCTQWLQGKLPRGSGPRYEEPIEAKSQYQELDMRGRIEEPSYQPLQRIRYQKSRS